jgi:hypothetical protein
MPIRSKRARQSVGELTEAAFYFFSIGPFFDGEDYELRTTEAERVAAWKVHKAAIIERYRGEGHVDRTWGEILEGGRPCQSG